MTDLQKHSGEAAWYGADLAKTSDWALTFDGAQIAELERAAEAAAGRDTATLTEADLPLPTLDPILRAVRRDVVDGRGFALLRGLPVDRWSKEITARAYWAIGLRVGRAVVQNRHGHVLGHVRDIGGDVNSPTQRGYQSAANLPFHTDIGAEVVGLFCLKPAKKGGLSSVVSAATIWNEMVERRPDLAEVLTQPFYRDRRGDEAEGQKPWYVMPVFMPTGGRMAVAYVRRFIESAQRFEDVPRLTAAQVEAMDLLDELAYDPRIKLDMDFRPGDIQLVNNLVSLHTRTEYEDWPVEEQKRHLFRLWLSVPDGWPLPEPFFARYGADPETGRPQGINLPPGTVPNAPLEAGALLA
jgi:hypothetical protein